jgi:hypothetical protein
MTFRSFISIVELNMSKVPNRGLNVNSLGEYGHHLAVEEGRAKVAMLTSPRGVS